MTHARTWRPTLSLATVTAAVAVVLGALMAFGGLALLLAAVTTTQPPLQWVTACVLIAAGSANLLSSRGIAHEDQKALLTSALATTAMLAYFAAALGDFGETFWIHGAYLLLALTLLVRARQRVSAAL